jgi:hypothetical protein
LQRAGKPKEKPMLLPGGNVVVPPSAITDIDWDQRTVSVRLRRDEIRSAPQAS